MAQTDSIREWGVWLRAPPRRMTGQERSKWLRDERDVDWGGNHGNSNYSQNFTEVAPKEREIIGVSRSDLGKGSNSTAILSGFKSQIDGPQILEANHNFKSFIGPTEEELTGLNMDERKRRRGPGINEFMEIEGSTGKQKLSLGLLSVLQLSVWVVVVDSVFLAK